MAKVVIDFDPEKYVLLLQQETEIAAFLNFSLLNDREEAKTAVKSIVDIFRSYHPNEGGTPEISGLKIQEATFNLEEQKGKVVFNYELGYYYACSDINTAHLKKETVNFLIDPEELTLTLIFLDLEIPSTADEF